MASYEIFAKNLLISVYILRILKYQGFDTAEPLHQKLNPAT